MNRKLSVAALGLVVFACGGNTFETSNEAKGGSGGFASGDSGGSGSGLAGGVSGTGGKSSGESGGTFGKGGGGASARGGEGSGKGGASGGGSAAKGGSGGKANASGGIGTAGKGGAPSGGSAAAGTGGSLGDSSCAELQSRYRELLPKARSCLQGPTDPCTVRIAQDPFCGCTTFVSRDNPRVIEELQAILDEASKRTCQIACPAIACIEPLWASCQSSGPGHSCGNDLGTDDD